MVSAQGISFRKSTRNILGYYVGTLIFCPDQFVFEDLKKKILGRFGKKNPWKISLIIHVFVHIRKIMIINGQDLWAKDM